MEYGFELNTPSLQYSNLLLRTLAMAEQDLHAVAFPKLDEAQIASLGSAAR